MAALGYDDWSAFRKVIEKAMSSCALLGVQIFDHFAPSKFVNASGRELDDYELSRFACGMTALNGDSKNKNVAAAQAYFVSIAEIVAGHGIEHAGSMDRLAIREEISEREITLSETAARSGVESYSRFSMAGYLGMYEMDYQSIRTLRSVSDKPKRSMLDFMGKDELAANLFRLAMTEGRIKKEGTRGQVPLERVAKEVGKRVRETVHDETGLYPEQLPTAQDIREIRKGLKRAGKELLPLDDMVAARQTEQLFLKEHLPDRAADAVTGCSACSGGHPASHNGSPDCQSGSIASGGSNSHCMCDICY